MNCFCRKRTPTRDDPTIMDAFSPEFARHWLAGQGALAEDGAGAQRDDTLSPAQQEALEELAERVNAARSVY
jgi:hypothetical protein